jgi:predicted nucleic acid-binding protein
MRVLLDICALVQLRDPRGDKGVKTAVAFIPDDDLYLSALTIGEISRAIALLANGQKKRALGAWLGTLERQFAERILPVDAEAAHLWGEITARLAESGKVLDIINSLVAATALRHGLHIMTCRAAKFEGTGVLIVDPHGSSEPGD